MSNFTITCESTVDMPYSFMESLGVPVLFYHYLIEGVDYVDDMGRDPEARPKFYKFLAEGKLPSTSQINAFTYREFFESFLDKGDVLHISFTSGQSGSVNNAFQAAKELNEERPDRRVIVVDSTCSSTGYGMLTEYAANMRDAGKSIDEITEWLEANKKCLHHQFFSTNMTQFKRTGRVSGATAAIATILNICPIMRLDDKGRIIAYDKVRGVKKAIQRTIETTMKHIRNGVDYNEKCYICHSECPEYAEQLKVAVEEVLPNVRGKIKICDIGTIIGSHSGPGTVAIFFLGDERAPEEQNENF